jgi:hypothetical protein
VNSLTLSISFVRCHLVFSDDFNVYRDLVFAGDLWISRDIVFLRIPCVINDYSFAIDLMHQPWIHWCLLSLSIQWQFQVLQGLCFRWGFMDQHWHNVFDNFIRQPWLYFCYRFDASVVSSLTLSIPYSSCHSVFIDDFKFNRDSVFADDLWISSDITFLTIPFVSHNSSFVINLMRQSWNHWRCWFLTSVVTQFSMMIWSSIGTLFSVMIYGPVVT